MFHRNIFSKIEITLVRINPLKCLFRTPSQRWFRHRRTSVISGESLSMHSKCVFCAVSMTMEDTKLDNPVWHSLNETHSDFALNYDGVKFYKPDYCPFGGCLNEDQTPESISRYAELTDSFYIVGNKPVFSDNLKLNKELVCNQMILDTPIAVEIDELIVELQDDYALFTLVNQVQPGYFKSKTSRLGSYYGIFKNDKLVAVTGERMKMNSFTEVSAVVTHPEHTGRGYAKQLVAHTANKIFSGNKVPFLHVAETNIGAIKLYEKLGFRTRRKISFWNLVMINKS